MFKCLFSERDILHFHWSLCSSSAVRSQSCKIKNIKCNWYIRFSISFFNRRFYAAQIDKTHYSFKQACVCFGGKVKCECAFLLKASYLDERWVEDMFISEKKFYLTNQFRRFKLG
jgi:hypothetical protein